MADPRSGRRIRIGLVGIGGFAKTHLAAIRHAEAAGLAELAAAVNIELVRDAGEEQRLRGAGVAIYRSLAEMLDRERGLGLVGIPCGIDQHAPLSVACLERGFPVLCEKPAAGDYAQALEMAAARDRSGKVLSIGYQHMYSRSIRRIKAITCGGRLGKLLKARTYMLWPRARDYYTRHGWAGKLTANGRRILDSPAQNAVAHYLQNLLYVAGADERSSAEPVRVYGENYRANDIESADTQYLRIRTREGCLIIFAATHAANVRRDPVAEFLYEGGRVTWELDGNGRTKVYEGGAAEPSEELDNGPGEVHDLPYLGVIDALRRGGEPVATIRNCMQHTRCIDALFTSASGITQIPAPAVRVDPSYGPANGPRSQLTWVPGIEDLMARMYEADLSLAEAGAEWGKAGTEVTL